MLKITNEKYPIIKLFLLILLTFFVFLLNIGYAFIVWSIPEYGTPAESVLKLLKFPNINLFFCIMYLFIFSVLNDKELLRIAYILKEHVKLKYFIYFILSILSLVATVTATLENPVFHNLPQIQQYLYLILIAVTTYFTTLAFPLTLVYELWEIKEILYRNNIIKHLSGSMIVQLVLLVIIAMISVYLANGFMLEDEEVFYVLYLYIPAVIFLIPLLVSRGMTKLVSLSKKYFMILVVLFVYLVFTGYKMQYQSSFFILFYAFPILYILLLSLYNPMRKLRLKNEKARRELEKEINYKPRRRLPPR